MSEINVAELAKIIEQVATGEIDINEGARRLNILESEPARYPCSTCKFFNADTCNRPGQPPRPEHPDSARCGAYEPRPTARDLALPAAPRNGRCLFK